MPFCLCGFPYLYKALLNTIRKGLNSEDQVECPLTFAEMLPVEKTYLEPIMNRSNLGFDRSEAS